MLTASFLGIISLTHYFGFYQGFVYTKGEDVPIIGEIPWNQYDGSLPYFAFENPDGSISYSFIRFRLNSFGVYWGTCDVENEEGSFNFITISTTTLYFVNEGYELVLTDWSPPLGTPNTLGDSSADILLAPFF